MLPKKLISKTKLVCLITMLFFIFLSQIGYTQVAGFYWEGGPTIVGCVNKSYTDYSGHIWATQQGAGTYVLYYKQVSNNEDDYDVNNLNVFYGETSITEKEEGGTQIYLSKGENDFHVSGIVPSNVNNCDEAHIKISLINFNGRTVAQGIHKVKANTNTNCAPLVKNDFDLWVPNSELDKAHVPEWKSYVNDEVEISDGLAIRNRLRDYNWEAGHEQPHYPSKQNNINRMLVKVENRGCKTSNPGEIKMYWTRARVWEYWGGHWHHYNRDNDDNNNGFAYGALTDNSRPVAEKGKHPIPYGQQITVDGVNKLRTGYSQKGEEQLHPVKPLNISSLAPGEEVVKKKDWIPPKPVWYLGDNSDQNEYDPFRPAVCLLARVVNVNGDPLNSDPPREDKTRFPRYAIDNNNVVLKNTLLVNLKDDDGNPVYKTNPTDDNGGGWHYGTHTVGVNNPSDVSSVNVDLAIENQTSQDVEAFSNYGKINLILPEQMWNVWEQSGAQGSGIQVQEEGVIQVTDPESATLEGIQLAPEHNAHNLQIGVNFEFEADYDIESSKNYRYRLNAYFTGPETGDSTIKGTGYTFNVNVPKEYPDTIQQLQASHAKKSLSASKKPKNETLSTMHHPNPFTDKLRINYWLPEPSQVNLKVLNIHGKTVENLLVNEKQTKGHHSIKFDAHDIPKGVYFYKLNVGDQVKTNKVIHQ